MSKPVKPLIKFLKPYFKWGDKVVKHLSKVDPEMEINESDLPTLYGLGYKPKDAANAIIKMKESYEQS